MKTNTVKILLHNSKEYKKLDKELNGILSKSTTEFKEKDSTEVTQYGDLIRIEKRDIKSAKDAQKFGAEMYSKYKRSYNTIHFDLSTKFTRNSHISSSKQIQIQLMEWVFAELDLNECIIVKSPQRLFTKKIKEACLAAQGFRCAIDNERLPYKGAEGAHDLAWILGGSTDYSNCFMVRKVHNRDMGIMTIQEYCDWGTFPGPDGLEND